MVAVIIDACIHLIVQGCAKSAKPHWMSLFAVPIHPSLRAWARKDLSRPHVMSTRLSEPASLIALLPSFENQVNSNEHPNDERLHHLTASVLRCLNVSSSSKTSIWRYVCTPVATVLADFATALTISSSDYLYHTFRKLNVNLLSR